MSQPIPGLAEPFIQQLHIFEERIRQIEEGNQGRIEEVQQQFRQAEAEAIAVQQQRLQIEQAAWATERAAMQRQLEELQNNLQRLTGRNDELQRQLGATLQQNIDIRSGHQAELVARDGLMAQQRRARESEIQSISMLIQPIQEKINNMHTSLATAEVKGLYAELSPYSKRRKQEYNEAQVREFSTTFAPINQIVGILSANR